MGDIVLGEPCGFAVKGDRVRCGSAAHIRDGQQIRHTGRAAFELAQSRSGSVCLVDQANVFEAFRQWREAIKDVIKVHSKVKLGCRNTDNAAMQLVQAPTQFDIIAIGDWLGGIIS